MTCLLSPPFFTNARGRQKDSNFGFEFFLTSTYVGEMTSRDQDQPWQLHLVKTRFSVHFRKGYHITLWRRAYLFLTHFGSTNKERQKIDASLSIIIRGARAPYSGDGGESGGGPCPEWPIPTLFWKKKRRRKEKKSSSFWPCPANKDFFFKLFPRVDNFCQTDVSPVK